MNCAAAPAELRDRQSIAAAVGAIEAAIRTRSSRRELHEPAVAPDTAGTVREASSPVDVNAAGRRSPAPSTSSTPVSAASAPVEAASAGGERVGLDAEPWTRRARRLIWDAAGVPGADALQNEAAALAGCTAGEPSRG